MSLSTYIQAQIAAAQVDAAKVFGEDTQPIDLDKRTTIVAKGLEIQIGAPSDVITANIVDKRTPEGPKLGQDLKSSGAVHAAPSTESWGKPNRR